jgi:hypothetical protein
LIVNDRPAAVIVVERAVEPVFACTENATLPEPLPEAPEVIVTQGAAAAAVQAQPDAVLTVKLPVPPPAPTFCDVAPSE